MLVIVLHLWYVAVVGIMKKVLYTCTWTPLLAFGRQFRLQVTMENIIESLECLQRHAVHIKCLRACCLLSAHPCSERSRSHRGRFLVQLLLTPYVECIE